MTFKNQDRFTKQRVTYLAIKINTSSRTCPLLYQAYASPLYPRPNGEEESYDAGTAPDKSRARRSRARCTDDVCNFLFFFVYRRDKKRLSGSWKIYISTLILREQPWFQVNSRIYVSSRTWSFVGFPAVNYAFHMEMNL